MMLILFSDILGGTQWVHLILICKWIFWSFITKTKKITLHDIFLTKLEGNKGAHEDAIVGKITKVSTDMVDEESNVESEEDKAT